MAIRTLVIVALLAVALPTMGQQLSKEEFPDTAEGRLDAALDEMRLWIQNAQIKLARGVTGSMSLKDDDKGPVVACCSKNILRIREERKAAQAALDEIQDCHEAKGDREALRDIVVAEEDLEALMRTIEALVRTANTEMATRAVGSVQRSYLIVEQSRKNLKECAQ